MSGYYWARLDSASTRCGFDPGDTRNLEASLIVEFFDQWGTREHAVVLINPATVELRLDADPFGGTEAVLAAHARGAFSLYARNYATLQWSQVAFSLAVDDEGRVIITISDLTSLDCFAVTTLAALVYAGTASSDAHPDANAGACSARTGATYPGTDPGTEGRAGADADRGVGGDKDTLADAAGSGRGRERWRTRHPRPVGLRKGPNLRPPRLPWKANSVPDIEDGGLCRLADTIDGFGRGIAGVQPVAVPVRQAQAKVLELERTEHED